MTEAITIYRWARERGIRPQDAYGWRRKGLPIDSNGRVEIARADEWLASHKINPRVSSPRQEADVSPATDGSSFLEQLQDEEPESIVRGVASLTFLRSQGRTLAKGSQRKFLDFTWCDVYPKLKSIETSVQFDKQHEAWVESLQQMLVPHNGKPASYGQGQKSLNVFLKFYVDYASRPDTDTSSRLRPWLHCPLDKVVMKHLSKMFPEDYTSRLEKLHKGSPQQRFSLSEMRDDAYREWQVWIRELSPQKPVLVDVLWAFKRTMQNSTEA